MPRRPWDPSIRTPGWDSPALPSVSARVAVFGVRVRRLASMVGPALRARPNENGAANPHLAVNVTVAERRAPACSKTIGTDCPGAKDLRTSEYADSDASVWPAISKSTSPACIPACSAGDPGTSPDAFTPGPANAKSGTIPNPARLGPCALAAAVVVWPPGAAMVMVSGSGRSARYVTASRATVATRTRPTTSTLSAVWPGR